jgi:hypothetical protein
MYKPILPSGITFRLFFLFCSIFWAINLFAQDELVIYPGDFNNDGVVNHYDIIPLGIAIFNEGFPRELASNEWIPQTLFTPWPQQLQVSGINFGFIDGNGDGFISPDDLELIQLNYDSTQTDAEPAPQPYNPNQNCLSCATPQLVISFSNASAFTNDTIEALVSIVFPPNTPAEAGAVAFAFNLTYNPDWIVEESITIIPDTVPDDLMFIVATPNEVQSWKSSSPGTIEIGIAAKTGSNGLYFSRPLFTFRSIVEDMIIRTADTLEVTFTLNIEDLMMLNIIEQKVPHNISNGQINLIDPASFTNKPNSGIGIIYPQPAGDILNIELSQPIRWIKLFSMDGKLVQHTDAYNAEGSIQIHTDATAAGIYMLVAKTEQGLRMQKIAIQKENK